MGTQNRGGSTWIIPEPAAVFPPDQFTEATFSESRDNTSILYDILLTQKRLLQLLCDRYEVEVDSIEVEY